MLLFLFLQFLLYTDGKADENEYKIVRTRFGAIRGKRLDSYGGQSGFAFAGIPEAKPPIGELRFREAQDPLPWKGVLDTFQYRNACLADPTRTYKIKEGSKVGPVSEDCLYINVFSSRKCLEKGGCAVMAIFHGGIFRFESPVIYRMETIVNNFANDERNIVVVTIPYRLAVNGLFHLTAEFKTSLDDNVLIKDCIFGLKWIQSEISAFGGDPRRVTSYGHSAGAGITTTLALIPGMEGLFQQFVAQSGPLNKIMDYTPTANIFPSRAVSEMAGCSREEEKYNEPKRLEEIIGCLRALPQEDLLKHYIGLNNRLEDNSETWIDGPGGVLPHGKGKLLKNVNKIRGLLGTVTAEFRAARYAVNPDGKANLTRLEELCSHLGYARGYHEPEEFTKECVKHYGQDNLTQFFDDDFGFYIGIGTLADSFHKAGGDIFVYSYDYWGAGPIFNKYSHDGYVGPSHSEDYVYILGLHRNDSLMTKKDYQIERIYSGIIANFINYGSPSYRGYEWKPWTPEKRNYFLIDFDKNLRMPGERSGYYSKADVFWNKYLPKKVGGFTTVHKFPPRTDIIVYPELMDYILAAWTGKSHHHDKTYNASMTCYHNWDSFLKKERASFLKHKLKFKAEEIPAADLGLPGDAAVVEEQRPREFSWLTLALAVAVVVMAGYIAVIKVLEYRRRKDYEAVIH